MTVEVPSGQSITLQEVVWNAPGTDGVATRFLFVAPAIAPGGGIDFDTASTDMQHLCDAFALPRVMDNIPPPAQIVISLSDRPVPFGQSAPEATQFFESYSIENGACTWEMF
ncbi:MAG: acetolactate synthase [Rhodobacteraceae bacterium PARR1]|nr:MAG: acetolactate synthase [Rhodobacteraceae bacterium PARR1]